MKRILFSLFLCSALCWPAFGANPNPEAVRCFEWFKTLGYPDLTRAPLAEIQQGTAETRIIRPGFPTQLGFVTGNDAKQFKTVSFRLDSETWTKAGAGVSEYDQASYAELNLREFAAGVLENARHAQSGMVPAGVSGHQEEHGVWFKLNVFFLAFACYEKGEKELAGELFEEAKKLQSRYKAPDDVAEGDRMRISLEMELGHDATFAAYHRYGGEEVRLPSRKEMLDLYRGLLQKFPHNPLGDRVRKIMATLEQMVKEDASRSFIPDQALAKLPPQDQAKELIYQLRDYRGYSPSRNKTTQTSACEQLYLIGYDAVPALIEALGDDRLTRSVRQYRSLGSIPEIVTVGDCAEEILEHIAGQSFGKSSGGAAASIKEQALAWWQKAQVKGEKEPLVEAISSGKLPPGAVETLKLRHPEAVEGALVAGAAKANVDVPHQPDGGKWIENGFIEELGKLKSKEATDYLVRHLTEGAWLITRVAAARALFQDGNPAALPAMIQEVKKVRRGAPPVDSNDFGWLASFLVGTGKNEAAAALASATDDFPVLERFLVVVRVGQHHQMRREHPEFWKTPESPDTLGTEEAFLVHELADTTINHWTMPLHSEGDFEFKSARLCDFAMWSLHQLDPQRFACSKMTGRKQRDQERLQAANGWRKEHHQPPLEISDLNLRALPPSESLKITSVQMNSAQLDHPPAFLRKMLELKGQTFAPDTLVQAIESCRGEKDSGIAYVGIEAVREDDLSGVRMSITAEPGVTSESTPWKVSEILFLGGQSLSAKSNVNVIGPPRDDDWHVLTGAVSSAIAAPPSTPFFFTVLCAKGYR